MLFKDEKNSKDDGLIHRFLVCAPKPIFHRSVAMKEAAALQCSLRTIFSVVYESNLCSPNDYTQSEEAAKKFEEYFDENRGFIEMAYENNADQFIR